MAGNRATHATRRRSASIIATETEMKTAVEMAEDVHTTMKTPIRANPHVWIKADHMVRSVSAYLPRGVKGGGVRRACRV